VQSRGIREGKVECDDAAGGGAQKMDFSQRKKIHQRMEIIYCNHFPAARLSVPAPVVRYDAISSGRESGHLVAPHPRRAGAGVQKDERSAGAARVLEPDFRAPQVGVHRMVFCGI